MTDYNKISLNAVRGIYDTLRGDSSFSVTSDYNKWRDWFLGHGQADGGYAARKSVFDVLSRAGYDVGKSYEDFRNYTIASDAKAPMKYTYAKTQKPSSQPRQQAKAQAAAQQKQRTTQVAQQQRQQTAAALQAPDWTNGYGPYSSEALRSLYAMYRKTNPNAAPGTFEEFDRAFRPGNAAGLAYRRGVHKTLKDAGYNVGNYENMQDMLHHTQMVQGDAVTMDNNAITKLANKASEQFKGRRMPSMEETFGLENHRPIATRNEVRMTTDKDGEKVPYRHEVPVVAKGRKPGEPLVVQPHELYDESGVPVYKTTDLIDQDNAIFRGQDNQQNAYDSAPFVSQINKGNALRSGKIGNDMFMTAQDRLDVLKKMRQDLYDKYGRYVPTYASHSVQQINQSEIRSAYGRDELYTINAAIRALEDSQDMLDEANRGLSTKWTPGSGTIGALRGIGKGAFDARTWDFGLTDLSDIMAIRSAMDKYDNGQKLNEAEQSLLDALAVKMATEAYFSSGVGFGYKAGQAFAQSIPFMLEMYVNPASGLGTSLQARFTRYALKRFGAKLARTEGEKLMQSALRNGIGEGLKTVAKGAMTRAGRRTAAMAVAGKLATRLGGDVAGAATMSATTGQVRVMADALNRMTGQARFDNDKDGKIVYAGHDAPDEASFFSAYAKAFGANTIENHSEMVGEYFGLINKFFNGAFGITKLEKAGLRAISKIPMYDYVSAFVRNARRSDFNKALDGMLKRAHYNGTAGEYLEEVVGNIENALTVGDNTLDDKEGTGVFNANLNIETFLSVALMTGALGTLHWIGYRTPHYLAKQALKKADKEGARLFEGNQGAWESFKQHWAEAQTADDKKAVLQAVGLASLSEKERAAYLGYVRASQELEGVEAANASAAQEDSENDDENGTRRACRASYEFGQGISKPGQRRFAQYDFRAKRDAALAVEPEAELYSAPDLYALTHPEATEEQKKAMSEYAQAKAVMEGMNDALQSERDDVVNNAQANVDRITNKDTGKVIQVKVHGHNGPVYVRSGVVVTDSNGFVDHTNSSRSIVLVDEAGNAISANPRDIYDKPVISEGKDIVSGITAKAEAKLKAAQDAANGVMDFAPGSSFQFIGTDGEAHVVHIDRDQQSGQLTARIDEEQDAAPLTGDMRNQLQHGADEWMRSTYQQYQEELEKQRKAAEALNDENSDASDEGSSPSSSETAPTTLQQDQAVAFTDADGNVHEGRVNGETADGGWEIEFDDVAPEGKGNVDAYTADELKALGIAPIVEGEAAPAAQTDGEAANAEDSSSPNSQTSETQSADESATPSTPAAEGEAVSAEPQQRAIDRIPTDGQGQHIYEKAKVEDTAAALIEQMGGDVDEAKENAKMMLSQMQAKEKKAQQRLEDIKEGKVEATMDEIVQAKQSAKTIAENVKYWEDVVKFLEDVKRGQEVVAEAEAKAEEAAPAVETHAEETHAPEVSEEAADAPKDEESEKEVSEEAATETKGEEEKAAYSKAVESKKNDADNGVKEWYDNIHVSDELDQNGSPFILSPNGQIDFGQISSLHHLPAAPIRLSVGDAENGYIHINKRHGTQIQKAGFDSIESFVQYVANNFTRIKEGSAYNNEKGGANQTYLIQLEDSHNNTLFVQLSRDGKYWNVNSAGVFGKRYGKNKKDVWSASEVQNDNSAIASDGSQSKPNADNGSTSNGTPSKREEISSTDKVTDSSAPAQESKKETSQKKGSKLYEECIKLADKYKKLTQKFDENSPSSKMIFDESGNNLRLKARDLSKDEFDRLCDYVESLFEETGIEGLLDSDSYEMMYEEHPNWDRARLTDEDKEAVEAFGDKIEINPMEEVKKPSGLRLGKTNGKTTVNPKTFAERSGLRPHVHSVFYENGHAVMTDGSKLLVMQCDYPAEYEGRVVSLDGKVTDFRYVNYQSIIPRGGFAINDFSGLSDAVAHAPKDTDLILWNGLVISYDFARQIVGLASKTRNARLYYSTDNAAKPIVLVADGVFYMASTKTEYDGLNIPKNELVQRASEGYNLYDAEEKRYYPVWGEKHSERVSEDSEENLFEEVEPTSEQTEPVDPDANLRGDIRAARDLAKMMFPDANPELLDKVARDLNQQPLTRKQREQMERIAKAFGLRIRWFKTMPQNGTYSREKGVICIATDSWHNLAETFGHEMTHALKDVDMEAYDRLKDAVMSQARNEEERKGLQKKVDMMYSGYDAKDRWEEYVSDTIGQTINSQDMARAILFRLDHKVLGRLRDIVTRMTAAVSDFSFNTENKVRNLLHMEERVRDERVPSALEKLEGAIMDAYRMAHDTEVKRRAEEKRKAEEAKKAEEARRDGSAKHSRRETAEALGVRPQTMDELERHGLTVSGGVVMNEAAADFKDRMGYKTPNERNTEEEEVHADAAKESKRTLDVTEYRLRDIGENEIADMLNAWKMRIAADDVAAELVDEFTPENGTPKKQTYDKKTGAPKKSSTSKKDSPIRSQNDIYRYTVDFDTACPNRFLMGTIVSEIERRTGMPMTLRQYTQLSEVLRAINLKIPCTYCYVENKRQALKEALMTYQNARQAVWNANTEDMEWEAMYGHSATKSRKLAPPAENQLRKWRERKKKDSFNPSLRAVFLGHKMARNAVLYALDEARANGGRIGGKKITQYSAPGAIAQAVMNEFNVKADDKESLTRIKGAISTIASEWKYDVASSKAHEDYDANNGRTRQFDPRVMDYYREMELYAKSSSSAKNEHTYSPYTDEARFLTKEDIDYLNAIDGLRMHSNNDFRLDYLTDYLQFFADITPRGLKMQTYTKSPDFVELFGNIGIRINMSCAMYGGENGRAIMENNAEGFFWKDAQRLREQYPNAGVMMMVTNDEQLSHAINSDWIDMIIPFHASSLPKAFYYDLRKWQDYSNTQNELLKNAEDMRRELEADGVEIPKDVKTAEALRQIHDEHFRTKMIYEWNASKKAYERVAPHFEPGDKVVDGPNGKQVIPGHHNDLQTYLNLCREYGVRPRFMGCKVNDGHGNKIDVTEHPNYMKLVREVSRLDSEQKPVDFRSMNDVNPYSPVIDELNAPIVFGDKVPADAIGRHMTNMEWGFLKLHEFAKNGGYGNELDYRQLLKSTILGKEGKPYDIAGEFIKDYVNNDRPVGWLSPMVKDYAEITQKPLLDAYGQMPYEVKESKRMDVSDSNEDDPRVKKYRLTDKEKDDSIKRIDERIAELNRLKKEQSLKSNVGNSAESHQNDGYLPDDKDAAGAQSVAPSSAKVNKKFPPKDDFVQNLADFISNLPNNKEVNASNFVKQLFAGIGMTPHGNEIQKSEYVRFTADDGQKTTIRLSDHSGNAISIIKKGGRADKGYSIVIQVEGSPETKFKSNNHSDVMEFVYNNPDKARLEMIAKGVFDLIDRGEYTDIAHADQINPSPRSEEMQANNSESSKSSERDGTKESKRSTDLNAEYGTRWLDEQTNEDGRHTTQVKNTINSYKKFGEWVKRDSGGRKVSVLDASSGLGLGTQWMRENGIEADDVEPYPSENRGEPTYRSYDDVDKKYDYIISNAVLNVIPEDWRENVLHNMADKLKDGGKMVINVRSAESIAKQGKEGETRVTLDEPSEILVLRPNGSIKAYQKGFTKSELKEWCEKELGDGYSVEIANNKNAGGSYDTAVVVTKSKNGVKESKRMPTSSELSLRDGLVDRLREAGLGVSLGEEEGQRVLDLANGRAREMRVYHGSHTDFDHFDHSFMNSGEGAQAYGWGSYVTEVEGIGRTYAEQNAKKHAPYFARYNRALSLFNIAKKDVDDILKDVELEKEHVRMYKSFLETSRNEGDTASVDEYESRLFLSEKALEYVNKKLKDAESEKSKRLAELNDAKNQITTDKPVIRHLYTVEIPDDTGSNYLDWDKPLTDEQKKIILDGLRDIGGIDTDEWDAYGLNRDGEYVYMKVLPKALGLDEDYYDDDSEIMKGTSEFLSEIGFTGIKYPADYMRGGRKDGAKNYVIFNDKDLEITDHVRFFRGENGEAYGFTVDGKIYIDPKHVNAETPIHEYTHLWATALQQKDAKAWGDVVRLMKDTGIWDEVREAYPELKTDDEIADEVLATYSGQRGAERLREEMRSMMQGEGRMLDKVDALSAMERVRNAIARFWRKVAEMLGIRYTKAEDVADHVLGGLLERVNPNVGVSEDLTNESSRQASSTQSGVRESRRVSGRLANTGNTSSVAQRIYEEAVRGRAFEWDEAWHDSLVSVKSLQDALAKERGVDIRDLENVYLHLVHLSSVSAAEMTEYRNKQVENLLSAMEAIVKDKKLKLTEQDVETYLNCKHGLERNEHIARKKAKAEADKKYADDIEKLKEAYVKAADAYSKNQNQQTKDAMDQAYKDCQDKQKERDDYEDSQYDKHRKKDDYSGLTAIFDDPKNPTMTNEELEDKARDLVAEMERKIGQDRVDALWDAIHDATLFSLHKSYKSGMISKEAYNEVKDMYEWYVPLRGFAEDTANDVYEYMEHTAPKTQQTMKSAEGRKSRSDGILANIMNMGSSAILHGNRNLAKQKLLNLAINSKSSLLSLNEAFYKPSNKLDANGKPYDELVPVPDYILNEEDADIRHQLMEQWTEQMRNDPDVKTKFDKLNLDYKALNGVQGEHAVSVFRGGQEYKVYVNGNPRAAQAINGTNIVSHDGALSKVMNKVTKFMSQMMTSYNPSFVTSNAQRDFTSALLISEAKYGAAYTAKFANNVRTVFPFLFAQVNAGKKFEPGGMYQLYWKYKHGKLDMNKLIEKYFSEFMANGGETGYTQSMSVDDYKDFIAKELKNRKRNKVVRFGKKPFGAFMGFVEELNRGVENSCRFAAYMTSRETGRSVLQSVQDAKEVSTNFNLHGSGALGNAFFRDAYAFINPAVQSLVQYGQLTKQHPWKMGIMAATTISLGALTTLLMSSMVGPMGGGDGDDESDFWNINPYTRRNYLLLPFPGKGNWIKIAMAPEIRVLYGLGVIGMECRLGRIKAQDAAVSILDQLNQLMPKQFVEPTETFKMDDGKDYTIAKQVFTNMMPTSIEPIWRASVIDRDFMGRQITNQHEYNEDAPEWNRASYNTSEWLVNASKWLNNKTAKHGKLGDKGWFNVNPSRWGYLAYSYGAGLGQLYDQGMGLFKGKVLEDRDFNETLRYIPVINRMFTTTDNDYNKYQQSNARFQYYEGVHDLNEYLFRNGKNLVKKGEMSRTELFGELWTDPEYNRTLLMDAGKWLKQIDKLKQLRKATNDEKEQREYSHQINEVRKNAVRVIMYIEENGGLDKLNDITAGYRNVKNEDQLKTLNDKRGAAIQQVLGEAMKKYPNPFPFKDSKSQKDDEAEKDD